MDQGFTLLINNRPDQLNAFTVEMEDRYFERLASHDLALRDHDGQKVGEGLGTAFVYDPKGLFAERWSHHAGCRRWFNAVRDTATYRFRGVYRMGESKPVTSRKPFARIHSSLNILPR